MARSISSAAKPAFPVTAPADRTASASAGERSRVVVEPARARAGDFLQATLDSLDEHIAVLDEHGVILLTNAQWESLASADGGRPKRGENYLAACEAAVEDADAQATAAGVLAILTGERETFELDHCCHTSAGERWFQVRATLHRAQGPAHVVVKYQDITSRRRAEEDARLRARLLDEIDAAVVAMDWDGRMTHWSAGAERLYGWASEDVIGRPVTDLLPQEIHADHAAAIAAKVQKAIGARGRIEITRKDGTKVPVVVKDVVLRDVHGEPTGLVGVSLDVSASVLAAEAARRAESFSKTVTDSMGEGLLAVDVDGRIVYMNKAAEELLGWELPEIAGKVVHEIVHHQRADGTPLAREDCVIMRSGRDDKVVHREDDVFVRRNGTLMPVAYTASPFETDDGLRGTVCVFSDITERKASRVRLEQEVESLTWIPKIRDALDEDRFILHAQPIIDLASGETVQHEVLIRMTDRDGQLVPPGLFLPVAETHGLIGEIDRWVIQQSAALAARGHHVELNLSAESLGDPGLFDLVERELRTAGADPKLVVFELTETALLRSEETAKSFIEGVGRLGCRLALDDFGTGYGGFTYLKRFPVHFLKIDIDFVRDLPRDEASQHVVHAVVHLAKSFGQQTVAEGVEDQETLDLLRAYGVDYAQGYFLGRPAPLAETMLRSEG